MRKKKKLHYLIDFENPRRKNSANVKAERRRQKFMKRTGRRPARGYKVSATTLQRRMWYYAQRSKSHENRQTGNVEGKVVEEHC